MLFYYQDTMIIQNIRRFEQLLKKLCYVNYASRTGHRADMDFKVYLHFLQNLLSLFKYLYDIAPGHLPEIPQTSSIIIIII